MPALLWRRFERARLVEARHYRAHDSDAATAGAAQQRLGAGRRREANRGALAGLRPQAARLPHPSRTVAHGHHAATQAGNLLSCCSDSGTSGATVPQSESVTVALTQ